MDDLHSHSPTPLEITTGSPDVRRARDSILGAGIPTTDDCLVPIPGAPDYFATASGAVYSSVRWSVPRLLKSASDTSGYQAVNINLNGKRRTYRVAVLIALTFHGQRPMGAEVCHIDGTRTNDRADNLRYGTRSDNAFDSVAAGTHTTKLGETNPKAKLTSKDVREIVSAADSGRSHSEVAKMFGITSGNVGAILSGRSWSHITGIPKRVQSVPRKPSLVNQYLRGNQTEDEG